jgi:hypothetical protein
MTLRRSLLVVALLGIAAAPAVAQRGVRLRPHTSEAGRFQARFPEKPDSDTKELALGAGGQSVPVTTEKAYGPDRSVFAVTYADYPEAYRKVPLKALLDGVRDGLKGTDGNIEKDDEVFLGEEKLAGREFRIVAGRKVIHARVFLKDARLYQVMVTGSKDRFPSESARAFHDSFELLK